MSIKIISGISVSVAQTCVATVFVCQVYSFYVFLDVGFFALSIDVYISVSVSVYVYVYVSLSVSIHFDFYTT